MSDEEILKLSYRNPNAFGKLFDRHSKRFLAISKKALRSTDDAEDVVQETFVRIYKYGKKFSESGGKFRPWANTILRNCITDQIRKYQRQNSVSLDEELVSPVLDNSLYSYEYNPANSGYMDLVLGKIDKAAAEIINLRYNLGKSFKEIGKILNINSGAARVRLHRSKKEFIKIYKKFENHDQS